MWRMRLYLSSYQLGEHRELLTSLVYGDGRGWVISNALDGYDEDRRQADSARQIAALGELGLVASELDLRDCDPSTLAAKVGSPDFLWVRGGNVFTLRMALARSGMGAMIVDGLQHDNFVYAGFSAGSCVLAPSLAGLEHCDSVEDCIAEYGEVRYDGLGVLDRPVVPHLDSPGHPDTEALTEVAMRHRHSQRPYWGLSDGQALVIDGQGSTIR